MSFGWNVAELTNILWMPSNWRTYTNLTEVTKWRIWRGLVDTPSYPKIWIPDGGSGVIHRKWEDPGKLYINNFLTTLYIQIVNRTGYSKTSAATLLRVSSFNNSSSLHEHPLSYFMQEGKIWCRGGLQFNFAQASFHTLSVFLFSLEELSF
jgi:hypothetical protein